MRYDHYSALIFGRTDWERLGARGGVAQARRRFGERLTIEETAALTEARERAGACGRLASVRFERPHPDHAHGMLLCRAIAHPNGRWMIGLIAPGGQPSAWILKADWPAEAPRTTNLPRPRAVANEDGHDRIARLIARLTAFLKARRAAESGLRTSGHA
jgi:hypothetical protein